MPQKSNITCSFDEAKRSIARGIDGYVESSVPVRIEIKIKPIDQLSWLSLQNSTTKVFGANQDNTASIAGVGEALKVSGRGKVNLPKIFSFLRTRLTPKYPYLQWYGGFSFDPLKSDKCWAPFGSYAFIIPRFELARDKSKMIFSCNLVGKVNKKKLIAELSALTTPKPSKLIALKVSKRKDSPAPLMWDAKVNSVLKSIKKGDCSKIVLARKTDLSFKTPLDPWGMLKSLLKVTPHSYHFAFNFGASTFLGASPERLYKRYGRSILSEALAGTKPRQSSTSQLKTSLKDQHEHRIVVDGINKALRPLCQNLHVDEAPKVLTLSNGHHLNTKFHGQLNDGVKDEDILQSMHPTSAVGGAPKAFALKQIRRFEGFGRGWYAGPLGYVGLDWAEFVVGIRSGLVSGQKLSVFAGAGIVEGSNPKDEWQEIEGKISNFIKITTP